MDVGNPFPAKPRGRRSPRLGGLPLTEAASSDLRRMRGLVSARLSRYIPVFGPIENQLLEDPAFINVFVRWITWLMAALIVVFGAAPADNLRNSHWLLVVTFVICALTTVFGSTIRPHLPDAFWVRPLDTPAVTSSVDIILSCLAVMVTGGWGSPFYEFALTSVIAPSLRYGTRGAFLSAALYSGTYVLAVRWSRGGHGLDALTTFGVVDGGFFSAVINPFMLGIFTAYLAEVAQRLNIERQRTRVLAAQEERNRIAREIHDGIAQHIYMLTLNLEACAELAEEASPPEAEKADLAPRLQMLLKLSKNALWEVRHYIFDLKPLLSGEKGLWGTVTNQMREFEAISGLKVEVMLPAEERAAPVATSTALVRIIQEGMANIFKHAAAEHILLSIRYEGDMLEAEVLDDGQGFDPKAPPRRGLGLTSLRHRAQEAGGMLTLESAPGVGTRIVVRLPLERRASSDDIKDSHHDRRRSRGRESGTQDGPVDGA